MNVIQRHENPGPTSLIILADISGSMKGDKIRRLRSELGRIWPEVTGRILAFESVTTWVDGPKDIPEPRGGTRLDLAFTEAAKCWPSEVLVISDGCPDNEQTALETAGLIPGTISVLFVGSDDDARGAEFLRRLALLGGGMYAHKDLAKNLQIGGELREMLALPAPIAL